MRRVSLALALMGAVTAACSGGAKSSSNGGNKGTVGSTFTVTIQNGQNGNTALAIVGGKVTSSPAGIDCGAGSTQVCTFDFDVATPVVLTATPAAANDPAFNLPYQFTGWAGDCMGLSTCTLSGNSDKYVVAQFAGQATNHPNFTAPTDHVSAYLARNSQGALRCSDCHGATLQGAGLAVACSSCHASGGHDWPVPASAVTNVTVLPQVGKHFQAAGHNSGTCARCHAGDGFRDFIGADGSADDHLNVGYTSSAVAPTQKSIALCVYDASGAVTNGPAYPATGYKCADAASGLALASGMKCDMCHNAATALGGGALSDHKFPSGKTITGMDASTAICSQCHDGGRPGYEVAQVNKQLTGVVDLDAQLSGSNNKTVRAHYLPAASTLFGEEAGNWFEYSVACSVAGKYTKTDCEAATPTAGVWKGAQTSTVAADRNNYTARNEHGDLNSCTSCHDPHTGALPADRDITAKCGSCHNDETTGLPVRTFAELEESRQFGFEGDIDGDGLQKPLNVEIDGLRAKLLAAMNNYATNVAGAAICFDGSNRFYLDNGNFGGTAGNGGTCEAGEMQAYCSDATYTDKTTCEAAAAIWSTNEYNKYTARLLRAGYNYFIATNDTGAWAHNPRYAIEVLYDAIADLNAGLVAKGKAASPNGLRAFNGHFGGAEDASKYAAIIYHGAANATTGESLPPMGFTSGACYQCHGGAGGFAAYLTAAPAALTNAVITDANKVTALQCSTCHAYNGADMKGLVSVPKVYFPPQKAGSPTAGEVSFDAANLPTTFAICGTCHSARENKATVDGKVLVAGTFNTGLVNMHYLGAAATVMGTRTKSWYEYDGKSYTAYPVFWKAGTNGNAPGPHGSPHGADCTGCHQAKESKHTFDVDFTYCGGCHTGPYALAPKEEEYLSMKAELLAALDAYAQANLTAFQAGNGGTTATGICYDGNVYGYVLVKKDTGCSTTAAKLDLNAMRAAYNLHWMNKDPGGWAHNEYYVMQLVYDSIVGLGYTPTFKVAAVMDYTQTPPAPVAGDPLNRGY